ncbi:tumor necrosis factor alpha-induced protein 2-like isoform X4 [Bos indicus x Bos taurus]|uniref:tumor necrosis factor alpha-induced protein 2-like isoform X4 n=1 Tax=Bos indicus x Bos taurus TaxID=30522 RepID=UPI000F7D5822|nr:tumor necrosis factor alpha-induced protein 2-like isoform X4 [Bos indicus x Bos taurus]
MGVLSVPPRPGGAKQGPAIKPGEPARSSLRLSPLFCDRRCWEAVPSRSGADGIPREVAPDMEEEEAGKKKKKSKGLATVFSVFTKRRKKKGKPSLAETEGESESSLQPPAQLPTVEELKADLERGRLEAAGPLLALELELQEAVAAGRASEEELVQRQSEVEALYALLRDQVLGQLRRPLEAEPERLRQALAVLAEQERQDHAAAAAAAGPPGCPGLAATRPRGWLQLWRDGVAQAAAERLSRRPAADAEGRTEAERAFLHMGRTMKEDLEAVVERLKPLFPADIRVVAAYAESYHAEFASQLAALTQFELCPRDTYMLLLWVQNLYPNDILNSPKLAPELQGVRLGTLLPPTQIRLLEATFLSNEVASVRELTARALELESNRWTNDEAPQRLDGHCHSELAIDIIQIISQGQAKAESITLDLGAQIKPLLLEELARFLRSYQRAFDGFLERCRQLRNYRANVIANINNCLPFRTSLEQQWQTPPDLRSSLLRPLNELKSHGFDTLLQSLFGDLKPLFKRFTQTRWAAPQQTLEEIVSAVAERMPEFSELQDCFREELLEAVHLHLVKEYIARLCKRRLVLQTAEQQQQLAGHVQANAQLIQQFCTQNGSPATWLHDALPRLAEIIRLQDPSAIKIEVASYATSYPDFSKGHLSAILTIKGNLSSSDAKSIRSILDINTGAHEPSKALFSLIKAWLRSWPLSRWNWNSCVLMTPPVEQEPSGEALWMRVELARPEGGVRRVCGSGTQLRDHCLSARSCHTCLRTALLRLGLQSPHLLTGARASPLLPAVVQDHVEPASASE